MLPLLLLLLLPPCLARGVQFKMISPAQLSEAVRAAAGSQDADVECRADMQRWVAALDRGELWASYMADSWSRGLFGVLYGNLYDFGDFDECVQSSSELEMDNSTVIRGEYFLPSVYINSSESVWPNATGALLRLRGLLPLTLRLALCVPDSCGAELLVAALQAAAEEQLGGLGLGGALRVTVSEVDEPQSEETAAFRADAADWAVLFLSIFLLLLSFVATIVDVQSHTLEKKEGVGSTAWRPLLCFSLRGGWRRLTAPAAPGSLRSISGLRVLSCLWIVLGHNFEYYPPSVNGLYLTEVKSHVPYMMLYNYSFAVDTFLAVGGLVCCTAFLRVAENKGFNFFEYVAHRYARGKRGDLTFHRVPAVIYNQCEKTLQLSKRRRALWLSRIKRADLREENVKPSTCLCSNHFIKGKPAPLFSVDDPDWAPSLHLGYNSSASSRPDEALSRFNRAVQRKRRRLMDMSNVENADPVLTESENQDVSCDAVNDTGTVNQFVALQTQDPSSDVSYNVGSVDQSATFSEAEISYSHDIENKLSELQLNNEALSKQVEILRESSSAWQKRAEVAEKESTSLYKTRLAADSEINHRRKEIQEAKLKIESLETQLKSAECDHAELLTQFKTLSFDLDTFKKDDDMVKFYTGLPSYTMFEAVLNLTSPNVPSTYRNVLPQWKELLLTLMRLRLNLLFEDLRCRFGISTSTASRIFDRWIEALYISLDDLIVWPSRESLRTSMPASFRKAFGQSVSVIIDCFEIFIERPSGLLARGVTWSNYKHHNTIKVLIGITPTGSICFVSETWWGRTSDKHLTLNSGFLEKLCPGDVVMADRGFDVGDDIGMVRAKLVIPAFTRGQTQLSAHDVASSRKIASVRIHVERVIGLLRNKYRILGGTLPIDSLIVKCGQSIPQIDKIIRVCSALTNLCSVIVPAN